MSATIVGVVSAGPQGSFLHTTLIITSVTRAIGASLGNLHVPHTIMLKRRSFVAPLRNADAGFSLDHGTAPITLFEVHRIPGCLIR